MTGFASATREDDRATIAVTVRALNHRYLDLQLRVPSSLATIEGELRALVSRYIARGRVELGLSVQLRQTLEVDVDFNGVFGAALERALDQARQQGLIAGPLTPGDLLRFPQALTIRERSADPDDAAQDEVLATARQIVAQALSDLDSMRVKEGERLRADLDERRVLVASLVERIAAAADEGRAGFEERLRQRVREIRAELQADETAVAQD